MTVRQTWSMKLWSRWDLIHLSPDFFSRRIKESFIYTIRGKDANGRPKIVGEREVEIPLEFQLQVG